MSETSHSQHDKLLTQAVSHISAGSDSTLVAKHIASARKEGKLKPKFAKFTCEYHEVRAFYDILTKAGWEHGVRYIVMFEKLPERSYHMRFGAVNETSI